MNAWTIALNNLTCRKGKPHHEPYHAEEGRCVCCGGFKEPEEFRPGIKTCNRCLERKAEYRERLRANRPPKSAYHINSGGKMTPEQVRAIRADLRATPIVADEYGLSKSAVRRIRQRKTWQHVE